MKVELYLAARSFFHRRHGAWGWLIGWLATGSMMVGVAALIITLAVMSGFREDIRSKILGVQPHIIFSTVSGGFEVDAPSLDAAFQQHRDVAAWAPYVSGQGLIGSGSNTSGAMIKGVHPHQEPAVTFLDQKMKEGHWVELALITEGKPAIFLGVELARNIGARVGDSIWVMAPEAMKIPTMTMPRAHRFIVKGLIQTGLYDYDSSLAYIDIFAAQNLFDMKNKVSGIGVRVREADESALIAEQLQTSFAGQFWVRSWLSMNRNLFSALKLERTVMFIILTLVTLVASVMIISNLLLMITQKVKEIGILRAMGATTGTIRRWFLYQGLVMGFVGNVFGVLLGTGVSLLLSKTNFIKLPPDVYYIDQLPVRILMTDVVHVVLAASVIVLVASLLPANRAAKLNPIEAIRYG